MKVFIHWSGDRSKQLAEAIREWLPMVLQFTKPYFSPADIDKGARWLTKSARSWSSQKIGIIAMTEENLTSPWIMFEAGAISKVVEEGPVRAVPDYVEFIGAKKHLVLGLSSHAGPPQGSNSFSIG